MGKRRRLEEIRDWIEENKIYLIVDTIATTAIIIFVIVLLVLLIISLAGLVNIYLGIL